MKIEENEKKLKYLDSVQVALIYAVVCLSSIYEYAKENSGPLKLRVQTVEGNVKTVISPVYDKFHDVPFELLKFVDCKARAMASKEESVLLTRLRPSRGPFIPSMNRQLRSCTASMSQQQNSKLFQLGRQWSLNHLMLFPQVAQIVAPMTAY
ncbi:hypothetical protein REPUB_Repub17cG0110100 [Reevesia pubescens]